MWLSKDNVVESVFSLLLVPRICQQLSNMAAGTSTCETVQSAQNTLVGFFFFWTNFTTLNRGEIAIFALILDVEFNLIALFTTIELHMVVAISVLIALNVQLNYKKVTASLIGSSS